MQSKILLGETWEMGFSFSFLYAEPAQVGGLCGGGAWETDYSGWDFYADLNNNCFFVCYSPVGLINTSPSWLSELGEK